MKIETAWARPVRSRAPVSTRRGGRAPDSIPGVAVFAAASLLAGSLPGEEIPRTPSGRPDFSGNYDVSFLTPLERDPRFGERQYLTEEEAEQIAAGMAAANARDAEAREPERDVIAGLTEEGYRGVGAYNAFWLDRGTAAFQVDGKYRTSVLTDPPDGRLPARTEAGQARFETLPPFGYENTGTAWWLENGDDPYDGPETLSLLDRCLYLSAAATPVRPILYNNMKTITQTEDHVVILVEWMHWAKVVRLNAEHAPPEVRSLGGDSIGWWEGDTLVVETTNFLASPRVPREGLKVVERFTRKSRSELLYEFTVLDPDYTAPYSGEFIWPQTDELNYEYACHEGNYAMGGILRGARLLEREYEERQGQAGSTGSGLE